MVSTRNMTVLTTWRVFPVCAVLELELCDIDVPALPRATAMVKANLKILRLRVRAMIGCGGRGSSLSSSLRCQFSFVSQLGGEGRKIPTDQVRGCKRSRVNRRIQRRIEFHRRSRDPNFLLLMRR